MNMECKIVTPYFHKTVQVKEITIDSGQGILMIYPLHTDFISSIRNNSGIKLKTHEGNIEYKVKQGMLKIHSNKALIVIDIDEPSRDKR